MVAAPKRLGERTRPRVQFPASRRKTLFGETPNTTRGDAYAPRTCPNRGLSLRFSEPIFERCSRPPIDNRQAAKWQALA
jgi:hypothetical protein